MLVDVVESVPLRVGPRLEVLGTGGLVDVNIVDPPVVDELVERRSFVEQDAADALVAHARKRRRPSPPLISGAPPSRRRRQ